MANRYCAAPIDHDFRGGTVTDEKHAWNIGNAHRLGTQRLWPNHRPVRSATSMRIDISNTHYATYTDLYLNEREGWVEPISLTPTILAFGIGGGLAEPVAKLSYEYGWEFEAVDEPMASYSGSQLMAPDQFWTDDDVVIKKDGTALLEAEYTLDRYEGMATVSGYDATAMYTASYTYPLPRPIALGTGLIATDVIAQQGIVGRGLVGLSSLTVEEISMRVSMRSGISQIPINMAAASLLDPFVYVSWG